MTDGSYYVEKDTKLVSECGSNYVVKREKLVFRNVRTSVFQQEAVHIWHDRQVISRG
jgi:hypothetical protein